MNTPYSVRNMNKVSDFSAAARSLDLRKRAGMVDALRCHDRHADDNQPFRYSNNVKLHSLNIPRDLQDKAYQVLSYWQESGGEMPGIEALFAEFQAETGQAVGFVGRSGGHIAMLDYDASDSPDAIRAYDMSELRRECKLLRAFDTLCDECAAEFMHYVTDYEFSEVTITDAPRAIRVLEPIDAE